MSSVAMMHHRPDVQANSWMTRAFAVSIVLAFHALALVVWLQQKSAVPASPSEMSISFELSMPLAEHRQAMPQRDKTVPPVAPVPQHEAAPVLKEAAEAPAPVAASPVPARAEAAPAPAQLIATEPDYKANYLNNTPPGYPLAARRMGMQGRVLLKVEVLASGTSGQIEVSRSSGYAMLDTAALNAVKSWRFVPATQAGHAVDKWFIIPIQFSLKESAA